jgi:two-component system OmpR family response regulator
MAYVLIVDDDEDFASAVAAVLRGAGHEVGIELDPQSGLASIEGRRPDLVILDVMFPEDASAGFELARTIRHYSEKVKDIPVLRLTAVNQRFPLGFTPNDIDESWMPVADFLEKPVDFDVLRSKVAALLSKAKAKARDAEK